MKLLIGTTNFHSKIFTEIWLDTLFSSFYNYNATGVDYLKVVVVNNSPEENIDDLKKKYGKSVLFIDNKENIGVAAAWNQIIKAGFDGNGNTTYDYFMPANNDIFFTKSWFGDFVKCLSLDTNKEFGWISSNLNDYKEPELTGISETIQVEGRYWGGLRPEADNVESVEQMVSILKNVYSVFGGIDKFAGLLKSKYGLKLKEMHPKAPLFALSKECIDEVGLFDEYNSPNGLHEDADYCQRINMSRFKIGMAYGAYCHHFSMMSRTKGSFKKEWWVESREKAFQEKWGFSSKEMDKITKENTKFRLDIGSGERPQRKEGEHWYHIDIDPQFKDVEFIRDISDLSNFDDNSVKEIYTSNVLEHVEHRDVYKTLYEWFRVLGHGAKIHIRVPNFRFAAEKYLQGSWVLSLEEGIDFNLTHLIFGGDHPGYPHIHKVGLDFNNLSKAMRDVGFKNITNVSLEDSWELRVEAYK